VASNKFSKTLREIDDGSSQQILLPQKSPLKSVTEILNP
jgi:hypothetical protein